MWLEDWNNKHLGILINILPVEPKNVRKKITQSAWSARSARSAQSALSAVCSLQSAWSAFWGDPSDSHFLQSNIASLLLFPPMFPRVRSPCTFSLSAPNTFFLLSSVVTLCSRFLFTDNIHHLIPGLVPVPVISSLTRDSSRFFCYLEFAEWHVSK